MTTLDNALREKISAKSLAIYISKTGRKVADTDSLAMLKITVSLSPTFQLI